MKLEFFEGEGLQLVDDAALYTRYTYLAAPLLMVALAALVGPALGELRLNPRTRLTIVAAGGSLLVLAVAWNLQLLVAGRALFLERAERTRALVSVALDGTPPQVDRDRTLILIPSPRSLVDIVAAHGSPLRDPLVVGGPPGVSDAAMADAMRRALEGKGPIGALPQ